MKPNERVLDVTNTLPGERVEMTIDTGAMAKIMSILTDLYSDPEMAVVREYSTNAYDAHVEAGQERPIEVTTPSNLSPFLVIRDYGLGLDAEDIREIYSRYGASTKTNSNDVVGMLGLGCKSALTYTDQFTLSSVKDGKCTQVSISRDENGAGSMTIVAEYETDEPSGTTVTVPAKKYNSFAEKAEYLFQFWGEGTALVDGKEPAQVTALSGLQLADDLFISNELPESVIVMGNVPYPFSNPNSYEIVAYVPIGSVDFTPSRESLQMNKRTTAMVDEIKDRVETLKVTAVQRKIDEATSKPEAARVAVEAGALFRIKGDLTYNGEVIPTTFRHEYDTETTPAEQRPNNNFIMIDGVKRYGRKGWSRHSGFGLAQAVKSHYIRNYPGSDWSPTKFKKLEQWQGKQENYHVPENYILVEALPYPEWIDPAAIIDWSVIEAEKITREGGAGRQDGRPTGSYKGHVAGVYAHVLKADEIDTSEPVFFCDLHESDNKASKIIWSKHPKATIVEMSSNRTAKFQRDFPAAKLQNDAAREIATEWAEKLSDQDLLLLGMEDSYYARERYAALSSVADEIDDPELAELLRAADKKTKLSDAAKGHALYANFVTIPKKKGWEKPAEKYPLLTGMDRYGRISQMDKQHVILYVNAAYAAEQTAVEETAVEEV